MAIGLPSSDTSMPLVKRLVAGGAGSRRRAAALIISGAVSVNGQPAESLNHAVTARDAVLVNGEPLAQAEERTVYLLLNKPRGYLCAVSDARGRPTVLDLVPERLRVAGLVPAGRLDAESTGLLLLSNDGAFVERVTHPRYGVVKEYDVLLDRPLPPRDQARLLEGVATESGIARVLSVSPVSPHGRRSDARYAVELTEGKKREVRLMMRALGRRVLRLTRVRVGGLRLGGLAAGSVRELSAREAGKASHG